MTVKKGRPTKFTPERIDSICQSVKLGLSRKDTAKRAGIDISTLMAWLAKGKRGVEPFVAFVERVKKAEGDGIAFHIANITSHAKNGNWQCSAWLLERCWGYTRTDAGKEEFEEVIDVEEVDVKELLLQIKKQNQELKPYMEPEIEE